VIESIDILLDDTQCRTYREFNRLLEEKKQLIVNLVDNDDTEEIKEIVNTLVHSDELIKLLRNMEELDIIGFWFIALKRCFTSELFRLSEMNVFLGGHSMMVKQEDNNGWLEQVLTSVYYELAIHIDPTIFYVEPFIHDHFKSYPRKLTVENYFSNFVFGEDPTQPILFSDFLKTEKDAEFLDDMTRRSLSHYYESGDYSHSRYGCMTSRNEATYTVGQVKKRERLCRNIMATFSHLRKLYFQSATDTEIEGHSQEEEDIRDLFRHIITGYETEDFIKLTGDRNIPPIVYQEVDEAMALKYQHHENDNASYKTLFEDNLYDSLLKINREKYQWVLPFDESEFSKRKMRETPHKTVRRQISDIILQENILWINLLTYEFYVEKGKYNRVTKKRKSDSEIEEESSHSSDSSTSQNSKKKKSSHATLTRTVNDVSVLSIIKGMGHLLIYNDSEDDLSESTEFTYAVKAGDNIRIPEGARYKFRYMDEHGNYIDEDEEEEEEEEEDDDECIY
jgi:hypothetical protein